MEWYKIEYTQSRTTLFKGLTNYYKGKRWDEMIEAGLKDSVANPMTTQLQWLETKRSPKAIFSEL